MAPKDIKEVGALELSLDAMRQRAVELMPPEKLHAIYACIARLQEREHGPKGIGESTQAPDFVLSEAWGAQFWLKEHLATGPAVLVFFRGNWCPYCELTLAAWQARFAEMSKRGIHLLAISPQYPEATGQIVKKLGLEFPVLCDPGNHVARKYQLVCEQEQALQQANESAGANLQHCNGDGSLELPIPATFAVGQDGQLLFRHVDPDFTRRAEPSNVLATIEIGVSNGLG